MHAWTCAPAGTFRDAHAQTNLGIRTRKQIWNAHAQARSVMRTRTGYGMSKRKQILACPRAYKFWHTVMRTRIHEQLQFLKILWEVFKNFVENLFYGEFVNMLL
jgi:hypothetical protein